MENHCFVGVHFFNFLHRSAISSQAALQRWTLVWFVENQWFLGMQCFYLLYRTTISRQNALPQTIICMICGKTQSLQKISIWWISRNSTAAFGVVTFLCSFRTLYLKYKDISTSSDCGWLIPIKAFWSVAAMTRTGNWSSSAPLSMSRVVGCSKWICPRAPRDTWYSWGVGGLADENLHNFVLDQYLSV